MARVQFLVTINTDPVMGVFNDPKDFLEILKNEVERFPETYAGTVALSPVVLGVNVFRKNSIYALLGTHDGNDFMEWARVHNRVFFDKDKQQYWHADIQDWMREKEKADADKTAKRPLAPKARSTKERRNG